MPWISLFLFVVAFAMGAFLATLIRNALEC
jgi:hypothetical protein